MNLKDIEEKQVEFRKESVREKIVQHWLFGKILLWKQTEVSQNFEVVDEDRT